MSVIRDVVMCGDSASGHVIEGSLDVLSIMDG